MKLLLCLLPLFLFLFVHIANAEPKNTERSSNNGGVSGEQPTSSDNEDSDVNTEANEDVEESSDSPNPESHDDDTNEDDDDGTIISPLGTKVLLKLTDKATSMFSNKSEEEILALQKKLAELKYGFSRN